jgi:hypothetical protein
MVVVMQDCDANRNGTIEPDEFLKWCVKSKHLTGLVVRPTHT